MQLSPRRCPKTNSRQMAEKSLLSPLLQQQAQVYLLPLLLYFLLSIVLLLHLLLLLHLQVLLLLPPYPCADEIRVSLFDERCFISLGTLIIPLFLRNFCIAYGNTWADNEPDYQGSHPWGVRPDRHYHYARFPFIFCQPHK